MDRVAFGTPRREQGTERYHNSNWYPLHSSFDEFKGNKKMYTCFQDIMKCFHKRRYLLSMLLFQVLLLGEFALKNGFSIFENIAEYIILFVVAIVLGSLLGAIGRKVLKWDE